MATGQPKAKADELFERLGVLARVAHPDDLVLMRIRKEAEGILRTHPAEASAILGTVAAFKYEEDEARRQFEIALGLAPKDLRVAANYPFALYRLGYFREAGDWYLKAHETAPSDIVVLNKTIESFVAAGRIVEAREIYESRLKLAPNSHHPWHTAILGAPAYLAASRLSEDQLEGLVNVAVGILQSSRTPIIGNAFLRMADDEANWMSIHLVLDEAVPTVVDLNVELARTLAKREVSLTAEDYFTVMYMVRG